MKTLIVTLGIALGLVAFDTPASAQPGRGHGGPPHGGRYYAPSHSYYRPVYPGSWSGYYPSYRYAYPAYRYAYPSYGYGYPSYGYGYGYPGYGYGYPAYGWSYSGVNIGFYRPGFSLGFSIPIQW